MGTAEWDSLDISIPGKVFIVGLALIRSWSLCKLEELELDDPVPTDSE